VPRQRRIGRKRRSGRTRKGSKWLPIALTESAQSNTRTNNTYLAAQYRRIKARRGHHKAIGAVKPRSSSPAGTSSQPGKLYNDLGRDYFTGRYPQRQIKRLIADSNDSDNK
jgi:transposase